MIKLARRSPLPFVGLLLSVCRPSAIIRRIISVIVYPVNRMFFCGRASHVGKEVTKIVPSLANLYTPAPVVFEMFVISISTSLAHRNPDVINTLSTNSGGREPVRGSSARSARNALARGKIRNIALGLPPTLTLTKPAVLLSALLTFFNDGPFSKLFTSQIKFSHGDIIPYYLPLREGI